MRIKPKKSLGQNFLHDKNIINKIINASNISCDDEVLEIGGNRKLNKIYYKSKSKKIFVVEKDINLSRRLSEKFMNKVNIINTDILKFLMSFIWKKIFNFRNLPYNISTKILSNWCLSKELKISKMILMFQKEVADRIVANVNSKNYSRIYDSIELEI